MSLPANAPSPPHASPWQRGPAMQLGAALLGAGPMYALSIASGIISLRSGEFIVPGAREMLLNLALIALFAGLILTLLHACGERPRHLNLQPGTFGSDLGTGVGLFFAVLAATFGVNIVLALFRTAAVPESNLAIGKALAADPLLLAVFLGPVVWLQAAVFEELTRVFVLTRLWHVWPGARWAMLLVWSMIFGLAHIYQGVQGVIGTAAIGLVLGAHYLYRGRVVPLIVAHGLYDTLVIMILLYLARHPELTQQLR